MDVLLVQGYNDIGLQLEIESIIPAADRHAVVLAERMLHSNELPLNPDILPILCSTDAGVTEFLFELLEAQRNFSAIREDVYFVEILIYFREGVSAFAYWGELIFLKFLYLVNIVEAHDEGIAETLSDGILKLSRVLKW